MRGVNHAATRARLSEGQVRAFCMTDLRFNCACGEAKAIVVAYEQERHRMTGGAWFRVSRCGGCNARISGSTIDAMRWRQ
jgi:hypothetical protein